MQEVSLQLIGGSMTVTLDKPISWRNASGDDATMLDALQPNILKAHTREAFTALFLKLADRKQARELLRELAADGGVEPLMKSAKDHLIEIAAFKKDRLRGTPYVGVGVSAAGYEALGVPKASQPDDVAFRRGMTSHLTQAELADSDVDGWDGHFRQIVDAVILIGDAEKETHDAAVARVKAMIAARPLLVVLGEQSGKGQHNAVDEGIEHFGYVDGRSQPLFFEEDIQAEELTAVWDPAFGPGRAIVPDPAAPDPSLHFGSYFVFRKLEQNVRLFKTQEGALATALGLAPTARALAGAMVVGRFEDGRPVTLPPCGSAPVLNDFDYAADADGGRCPFFGHIRKMNPRGSGGFESLEDERLHIMARRGQTYGERTDDLNDEDPDKKPTGGVGLLFMAFNASLVEQFEFVQKNWANNADFPRPTSPKAPGLDLIIGHGKRPPVSCPTRWDAMPSVPGDFKSVDPIAEAVTMKGGEYFFMPSLAFLRSLSA
jgi:Dyp-type peroxidase family